ncbi:MAG: hypothetical protein NVS3B24_18960 [Candidatus Dormibacteria bacterium]
MPDEIAAEQPPSPPGGPEPTPLEIPLEDQIKDLPPLQYPGGESEEFQKWAENRRQRRLRVEIGAGILVVLGGGVGLAVTHRSVFLVIAVFAVIALAAYEFLVNSFE